MARLIDLSGQRFGRWLVLHRGKNTKSGKASWLCKCDCGEIKEVLSTSLIRKKSMSCGCLSREIVALRSIKHGACSGEKDAEYRTWTNMKSRCYRKDDRNYKNYGGRGIKVCNRWKHSYVNFISDMGPRPDSSMSIDRINNDGDYEPRNCRWATTYDQSRNMSRNVILTYRGVTMILTDLAKYLGVTSDILGQYLRRGKHTIDEAINHYRISILFQEEGE